ncbi:hypothetical protein AYI68_g8383 [Smittium mucronatum]|uniref:Uncharacterized protein n=1 Tax=Smittium mucronatum TaxID=133383 RepID=A0A1R0GL17_9FUNG|nr:hypothetical protein AYI68_g8383 [Smittium mucronatum]
MSCFQPIINVFKNLFSSSSKKVTNTTTEAKAATDSAPKQTVTSNALVVYGAEGNGALVKSPASNALVVYSESEGALATTSTSTQLVKTQSPMDTTPNKIAKY